MLASSEGNAICRNDKCRCDLRVANQNPNIENSTYDVEECVISTKSPSLDKGGPPDVVVKKVSDVIVSRLDNDDTRGPSLECRDV